MFSFYTHKSLKVNLQNCPLKLWFQSIIKIIEGNFKKECKQKLFLFFSWESSKCKKDAVPIKLTHTPVLGRYRSVTSHLPVSSCTGGDLASASPRSVEIKWHQEQGLKKTDYSYVAKKPVLSGNIPKMTDPNYTKVFWLITLLRLFYSITK